MRIRTKGAKLIKVIHKSKVLKELGIMGVPFNITKYEEEKFKSDFNRFQELSSKYKNDIDEVLEFARLYKQFVCVNKNKYT